MCILQNPSFENWGHFNISPPSLVPSPACSQRPLNLGILHSSQFILRMPHLPSFIFIAHPPTFRGEYGEGGDPAAEGRRPAAVPWGVDYVNPLFSPSIGASRDESSGLCPKIVVPAICTKTALPILGNGALRESILFLTSSNMEAFHLGSVGHSLRWVARVYLVNILQDVQYQPEERSSLQPEVARCSGCHEILADAIPRASPSLASC